MNYTAEFAAALYLLPTPWKGHHPQTVAVLMGSDADCGFLRYAAYRDRTTAKARLFNREGDATPLDRRELARYVFRSTADSTTKGPRRERAIYRIVLSPEDARGSTCVTSLARSWSSSSVMPAAGWARGSRPSTITPHIPTFTSFWQLIARSNRSASGHSRSPGRAGVRVGCPCSRPTHEPAAPGP